MSLIYVPHAPTLARDCGLVKGVEGLKQKQKPILVFISSHEMHPNIANDLICYDIRHISRRFYSLDHLFENIDLICAGSRPKVIMATLPKHWIVPFIKTVREKWTVPGVTVVRPVMYGDRWLGRYERRYVDKTDNLHQTAWIPQGSELDKQRQAQLRQERRDESDLLKRLEEL